MLNVLFSVFLATVGRTAAVVLRYEVPRMLRETWSQCG